MFRRCFFFTIICILIWGCSLDYKGAFGGEKQREEIPDTILYNFKHVVVEDNKKLFQIEADEATVFKKKQETLLENIHFLEYDKDGNIVTEGFADNARFHTGSEDAEIWGSVYFYSAREGAELLTPSLSWKKDSKVLQADPKDLVRINKDDGSYIQGRGFLADLRRKSVSFLSQVRGRIVRNDEEK
ncbi:MAG: LPS export ABC transporter periplasmic protein LptC [Spirochaetia bacterium]